MDYEFNLILMYSLPAMCCCMSSGAADEKFGRKRHDTTYVYFSRDKNIYSSAIRKWRMSADY